MDSREALEEARKEAPRAQRGKFKELVPIITELKAKGFTIAEIHDWLIARGLTRIKKSSLETQYSFASKQNGKGTMKKNSPDLVSKKIKILRHEGMPQKQAVAEAISMGKAGRITKSGGYRRVGKK
jgi:hypothetical protein